MYACIFFFFLLITYAMHNNYLQQNFHHMVFSKRKKKPSITVLQLLRYATCYTPSMCQPIDLSWMMDTSVLYLLYRVWSTNITLFFFFFVYLKLYYIYSGIQLKFCHPYIYIYICYLSSFFCWNSLFCPHTCNVILNN
jgi:hypothetical protein